MALFKNGTASQQIKSGAGKIYGVVVNSHSSGTARFNDGLSGTTGAGTLASGAEASLLMTNTFTFPAGSQVLNFSTPIDFVAGLYLTIGGTIDYTIIYE